MGIFAFWCICSVHLANDQLRFRRVAQRPGGHLKRQVDLYCFDNLTLNKPTSTEVTITFCPALIVSGL